MEEVQIDGFHKVKAKITHGVPCSAGLFRTEERVQIGLSASVIGEKQGIDLLVKPDEYRATSHTPGIIYYPGRTTFWLYKTSVFIDFNKRKRDEVKRIADRLLAPPKPKPRPTKTHARVPNRRDAIPKQVKIGVWQRDSGRCVECGARENLEFDHIIPVKLGGANTFRNLQLLCSPCNRSKAANL